MWNKLIETDDFISFEKRTKIMNVRIEARLTPFREWDIFVTHYNGKDISYTEEYKSKTKEELFDLLSQLQKMKIKSKKEIERLRLLGSRKLKVNVVREFRDYTVEKWRFNIENDNLYNFVIVRDAEYIDLDVVMHEKYRSFEKDILFEVYKFLGLEEGELPIRRNIFYYSKRNRTISEDKKNHVFLGKIEFDFGDNKDKIE